MIDGGKVCAIYHDEHVPGHRGVAVGLRKNDVGTKRVSGEAIGAPIADGSLKRLSEKWFKADTTPPS